MRKKCSISSPLTCYHKFILPFGGFVIWGIVVTALIIQEPDKQWGLTFLLSSVLLFVAVFIFFLLTSIPLKRVEVDGDSLFISNFRKTIQVPRRDIEVVTYPFPFMRPLTACIKLKNQTPFGKEILFLPGRHIDAILKSTDQELEVVARK